MNGIIERLDNRQRLKPLPTSRNPGLPAAPQFSQAGLMLAMPMLLSGIWLQWYSDLLLRSAGQMLYK